VIGEPPVVKKKKKAGSKPSLSLGTAPLPSNCSGAVFFKRNGEDVVLKGEEEAAIKLQARWRGNRTRREMREDFGFVAGISTVPVEERKRGSWEEIVSPSKGRPLPPSKLMQQMMRALDDEDRWLDRVHAVSMQKHAVRRSNPTKSRGYRR